MKEPTTTSTSAQNSTSTPSFWYFGSLPPLMSGARNSPAARKPVAIQNSALWMCQVRTSEYGNHCETSIP